jgi:hypothetical protein
MIGHVEFSIVFPIASLCNAQHKRRRLSSSHSDPATGLPPMQSNRTRCSNSLHCHLAGKHKKEGRIESPEVARPT